MIFQGSFNSSQTKIKILSEKPCMFHWCSSLYACVCVFVLVCVLQPFEVVQTCVSVTLKGEDTYVYRVTLLASVSTAAHWPLQILDVRQWGVSAAVHSSYEAKKKKSGEINLLWHIFINYVFVVNLFWVGSFCSDCKGLMSLTSKACFTRTGSKRFEMCLINPSSCWWTSMSWMTN